MRSICYNIKKTNINTIKSVGVTVLGNAFPVLLTVLMFPTISKLLGIDNFGFFLACWASLGFTSLLDFGFGRAITHHIAIFNQSKSQDRLDSANTSFALLFVFGLIVTLLLLVTCLIFSTINTNVKYERIIGAYIIISCIPFAVITAGLRGFLEGKELFLISSVVRSTSGIFLVLFPVITSSIYQSPPAIALGFLIGRVVTLGLYYFCEKKYCRLLKLDKYVFDLNKIKTTFQYSFWIGISNLFGTFLAYMDRISITLISTLSEMAYYSTPFEVISRILIIPGAIITVIFPKMSSNKNDSPELKKIIKTSYILCASVISPILIFAGYFSSEILENWMGGTFSTQSSIILRVTCIGIFFNSLAHIPFAAVQAIGSPQGASKIHMFEIIPSALLFIYFVQNFGALGASYAWMIRAFCDLILMQYVLTRLQAQPSNEFMDAKC